MEIKDVWIEIPEDSNVVVETANSIKTVEDILEITLDSVLGIRF